MVGSSVRELCNKLSIAWINSNFQLIVRCFLWVVIYSDRRLEIITNPRFIQAWGRLRTYCILRQKNNDFLSRFVEDKRFNCRSFLDSLLPVRVLVLQIFTIFPVFNLKPISDFFIKCPEFSPYKPATIVNIHATQNKVRHLHID